MGNGIDEGNGIDVEMALHCTTLGYVIGSLQSAINLLKLFFNLPLSEVPLYIAGISSTPDLYNTSCRISDRRSYLYTILLSRV